MESHKEHTDSSSRREFLRSVAAIEAVTLISRAPGMAQSTAANPRRIDFHHHFQSPEVFKFAEEKGKIDIPHVWQVSKDLEDMDRAGTATALLSAMGQPAQLDFGDAQSEQKAVRMCNDYAARVRADHPGRFGVLAVLPLWYQDMDATLREIEYAIDKLNADGFGILTSTNYRWLGDESWTPMYEELNRRKATVFVHPHTARCCDPSRITKNIPNEGAMIEFGTDTTRTIANVLFTGLTLRYPNINFVFSHAGGMMPYIVERFFQGGASAEVVPGIVTKGQDGAKVKNLPTGNDVLRELRKLYYDTAQSSNPVAMGALRKVVPVSQIVFGTDYWFRTATETSRGLTTNKVFNFRELQAINRGNAERILPRYRS